jgi:hypothetical protein
LLALEQCARRNLQPGPLNTYNGWLERKRQVRKGEKGITLCMPMPFKNVPQADGVQDECDLNHKFAVRQGYGLNSADEQSSWFVGWSA